MFYRLLKSGLLSLFLFGFCFSVSAADLAKAKHVFETVCATCHGADGITTQDPTYPRLAGQHKDYLLNAMLDYKQGLRKNPLMAQQMQGSAKYSRQEIEDMATYISSLPSALFVRY
jgi:cytochrome c553